MSILCSDRKNLTREEVGEGFHLLGHIDRLRRHQEEGHHGLSGVGIFLHDAEAVAAILPAYAAEVSRRIAEAETRLAELGIDASPVPIARGGATVVIRPSLASLMEHVERRA